jgi:hypothetical protein
MKNLKTIKFKNYATRFFDDEYYWKIPVIEGVFCTDSKHKVTSIYSSTDSDFDFPPLPFPITIRKRLSTVETYIIEDGTFDKLPQSIIYTDFEEKPLLWGDNWNGYHKIYWDFEGAILIFDNKLSEQIVIPETGYNFCSTGNGETLKIEIPNPVLNKAEFLGWTTETHVDYFDYENREIINFETCTFSVIGNLRIEFGKFYLYPVWRII